MRLVTRILDGSEVELVIKASVGSREADNVTAPLFAGLYEQVATMFGEGPEVARWIHPPIRLPSVRKVTRPAAETFAEINIGTR